jgi:hypothetical protein
MFRPPGFSQVLLLLNATWVGKLLLARLATPSVWLDRSTALCCVARSLLHPLHGLIARPRLNI